MFFKQHFFFFLIFFLSISLLISITTKGIHYNSLRKSVFFQEEYIDVFRSLQGLLTLDSIFLICTPMLVFLWHQNNEKYCKLLFFLLFISIFTRFILSICFLAGNDSICSFILNNWEDLSLDRQNILGGEEFYSGLKAAWIYEIIAIIAIDLIGSGLLNELEQKFDILKCFFQ